jgi:hypothetical protein
MTKEIFYQYLDKIRPLVDSKYLEVVSGIPEKALTKHYRWRTGKMSYQLPQKHFANIVHGICSVIGCVQIDGTIYTSDGLAIFAFRPKDREGTDTSQVLAFGAVYDNVEFNALFF